MVINVLVNGANGKMGQLVVKTLSNHADFCLVATTSRNDNLAAEIKSNDAHVVVDLTCADAVFNNTQTIIESGAHPVIGTSGLLKEQIVLLQERCKALQLGGIIAPNFSLGTVLMIKYAQQMVKYFSAVEIIEMHHAEKLDSPSGTALYTAEMLAQARPTIPNAPQNKRETVPGARGANYQHIPIHAIRLPGVVANQQIIFGSVGETLTLRHDTIDRVCFMPGVVLACKKVVELDQLIYGLEYLL